MTSEELNTAIYEKMAAEQNAYRDRLLTLPPDEILQHAYEYAVRQDILFAMEDLELQPEQCRALLKSPSPVADILKDFEKLELGYMDTIRNCIEGRASKMMQLGVKAPSSTARFNAFIPAFSIILSYFSCSISIYSEYSPSDIELR